MLFLSINKIIFSECKYNNHVVPDQMQFSPPDDPCARCICQQGNITCVRETCPKLLCRKTELPSGACCPICKGEVYISYKITGVKIYRMALNSYSSQK